MAAHPVEDACSNRHADLHRQIGYLAAFMRQVRFWEMAPDDGLVRKGTGFALGSTNELAAYLPAGGSVTLDLSKLPGHLEAHWFNPRAGLWGKAVAVSGGQLADFAAPSADGD